AGFLAHGVQTTGAHEPLEFGVLRAGVGAGADPLGLAFDGGGAVAHLEPKQLPSVRGDRHGPRLRGDVDFRRGSDRRRSHITSRRGPASLTSAAWISASSP